MKSMVTAGDTVDSLRDSNWGSGEPQTAELVNGRTQNKLQKNLFSVIPPGVPEQGEDDHLRIDIQASCRGVNGNLSKGGVDIDFNDSKFSLADIEVKIERDGPTYNNPS